MDQDQLVFVCNRPWAEIRARITASFNRGGPDALLDGACLLAEAVVRGKVPAADDLPERVWSMLRTARHPLGWLSPRMLGVESQVSTWQYRPEGGASVGMGYDGRGDPLPDGAVAQIVSEQHNQPESLEAFTSLSNGKTQSIALDFANPQALTTGLVRAIESRFEPANNSANAVRLPAKTAVVQLLAAALNGGAYNRGNGAAFGRLEGWRSIRWLCGTGGNSTMERVAARATQCSWLWLATSSDWFYNIAWDGCIGCLNPDGRRFAVVAWTDTD